jgi:hypothetical protein
VTKVPLIKFIYNNSVHSTINISPFLAIYDFYFNVPSSVRDNRLKGEVFTAKKKTKEFENEGKKLKKR